MPVSGGYVKAGGQPRSRHSAVERAAVIAVDQFHAEVLSIEKRLMHERSTLARIEQTVNMAGLTAPEAGYVRLRYFEARSVEAAAQRLYCSVATCGRLRVSALNKIERVLSGDTAQALLACSR
jgi:DNA-directed RNA polymerase specialized sigma24 family protein